MATNKTISPTNVTVSIPALGDQPDASVFSNCIDKAIDGINTLNSQITPVKTWLNPTMPDADVTIYGSEQNYYIVCGHTISISVSLKIENAQTGFANRKTVNLNLPSAILPHTTYPMVTGNGDVDGVTLCSLTNTGTLIIFPQKNGTTYVQGLITYIR